jgi:GNAT superfamily N-acetyltransferase
VHWLAVLPAFQGRGLGKALMTVVCQRLRDLGHQRACLSTLIARGAALELYRQFGFRPLRAEE